MHDKKRQPQSAYYFGRAAELDDIDQNLFEAMRLYLVRDLGVGDDVARLRAAQELAREIPGSVLNYLARANVPIFDADVLDLGAGLGGMSEELLVRGARVIALEPGFAWANLARRRAMRHGGAFLLLTAIGEAIPLRSESVDLVISLQALEHVKDPGQVLAEVWRILRPGGYFFLVCENYLSFREPHYRMPWFPLLPKSLGRIYLRACGRSPKFLDEAVTYTTYPSVLRQCRKLGFKRRRDEELAKSLREKMEFKWKALRLLTKLIGEKGLHSLDRIRLTCKFTISELFSKPSI